MASTALAVVDPGGYLALNHDLDEVRTIIDEVLGGDELTEFDLPRVKVPSGGGTTWEIPLPGTEPTKTLSGILLYFKLTRSYWSPEQANGSPPQCRSIGPDKIAVGIGDPGGPCRSCPLAQYGSAIDEKTGDPAPGQACSQKEVWFLLQPGSVLPLVLALPATSLKAAKQYRTAQLGASMIRPTSVITEIKLVADKSGKGDPFSRAEFAVGGRLDPAEAEKAAALAAAMRDTFDVAAQVVAADQGGGSAGPRTDDIPGTTDEA